MADKKVVLSLQLDSKEFNKELKNLSSSLSASKRELSGIDKALKLDPGNLTLLAQRSQVLTTQLKDSKEKAELLRKAIADMKAQGVDETSSEFRKLQRELLQTEANVNSLQEAINKINFDNSKIGKLAAGFEEAGNKLQDLGSKTKGLSLASAAIGGGMIAAAAKAGAMADDLNTLSKVTGIGTEQLQRLKFASDLVDVSVEDVAKSMQRLTRQMDDANQGSATAAEAFERLGINVTDNNGQLRSTQEVFNEAIDKLGALANATERDAIAMDLFGRSAQNLNPLIAEGSQAFNQIAESAKGILTQEQLDRANAFNDSLDLMKAQAQQTAFQLGALFADDFAAGAQVAQQSFQSLAGVIEGLPRGVSSFVLGVAGFGASVSPVLSVVGNGFIGLSNTIKATSTVFGALSKAGKSISGLSNIVMSLTSNFGVLGKVGAAAWGMITGPIGLAVAGVVAVGAAVYLLYTRCEGFRNGVHKLLNGIVGFFKNVAEGIMSVVNTIAGAINAVGSFFGGIGKTVSGLFGGGSSKSAAPPDKSKIPKLSSGADFINRSGLAVLHHGEAVVTQSQNSKFDELLRRLDNNGGGDINVTLEVDGEAVARKTFRRVSEHQAGDLRRAKA